MKPEHLSDTDLQQFALSGGSVDLTSHIESCQSCRQHVEQYKLLIKGIEAQESATFSFDLAGSIMNELEMPKPVKRDRNLANIIAVVVFTFLGSTCYVLIKPLKNIISDTGSTAVYLSIATIILLGGFLCYDMYRSFTITIKRIST